MVSCHRLDGTAWDLKSGCIPLVSAETACGEGTVWDTDSPIVSSPTLQTLISMVVYMTDLLDLFRLRYMQ